MKRKCVFCMHINCQNFCEIKQKKVSANGTCGEHKYKSNLSSCKL